MVRLSLKILWSFIRDWSLIMGRGATKREGGHVKFYPYEKRGWAEKFVAMLQSGGHNKFRAVFFMQ